MEHPAIRSKVVAEERLYLARGRRSPNASGSLSEEIVEGTEGNAYARALIATSKINKNAYVRILQEELRGIGYDPGRSSGYLTRPTIRAVNSFCRDFDLESACIHGPAKAIAIKAVSTELARVRAMRREGISLGRQGEHSNAFPGMPHG